MATAARCADNRLESEVFRPSRDNVLARYRHLREIGKRHHTAVMDYLATDAILQQASRLGLASGRTIMAESEDELTLAFDLAIHTATAGRSRAIDRYARSTALPTGSDEGIMLEAMRSAQFAIVAVENRHPTAGLIVTDMLRNADLWLMDEGLERSLRAGDMFATRYYKPADFAMTAGVCIPLDLDLLEVATMTVPQLGRLPLVKAIDDRRFAEAIYRAAIMGGVMEGVEYRDPHGDDA
jgi:hypothetical protein